MLDLKVNRLIFQVREQAVMRIFIKGARFIATNPLHNLYQHCPFVSIELFQLCGYVSTYCFFTDVKPGLSHRRKNRERVESVRE
jgi:hypothetical protein